MGVSKDYGMALVSSPAAAAFEIARRIVRERLAACAQITQDVSSVYWWKDSLEEEAERLILLKTRKSKIPAIRDLLAKIHPHEVPELIFLPITDGSPAYLQWLAQVLT